jgi:hypothetical protein
MHHHNSTSSSAEGAKSGEEGEHGHHLNDDAIGHHPEHSSMSPFDSSSTISSLPPAEMEGKIRENRQAIQPINNPEKEPFGGGGDESEGKLTFWQYSHIQILQQNLQWPMMVKEEVGQLRRRMPTNYVIN